MTTPGVSRGQPPFDQTAQDAIAAARGQPRYVRPPEGYEPFPLTPEEKAEARKPAARSGACFLCGCEHALPNTPACPRLASFEVDGEGRVKAGTFRPGKKWAKGLAVFIADLLEEDEPDGG